MSEENLGYLFTAEETHLLRRQYIEKKLVPPLRTRFAQYPRLRSAALCFAQYWDDEANDAVHDLWFFSILETPDFKAAFQGDGFEIDAFNLPGLPTHWQINRNDGKEEFPYEDNGLAIPLFAAYCREDCHQSMDYEEAYSLFAIFRKTGTGIEIEFCGEMLRPWLEGVCPERCEEYSPEELETLKAAWVGSFED
jgi:hypothetical protein